MSKSILFCNNGDESRMLCLPVDPLSVIQDWTRLRVHMTHTVPEQFSRDEWAYLITFLSDESLHRPFVESFGVISREAQGKVAGFLHPRGPVAVWLPSNVSLLGPLMLILVSLSGCPLRMKCGSRAENLAAVFLDFARVALQPGDLKSYLDNNVLYEQFQHDDPRQNEMAANAQVHIVFGSDDVALAVRDLERPLHSVFFPFTDRQSEAWIDTKAMTDDVVAKLIRVFAMYGQAGCTSPKKVVLLNGSLDDALSLKDRIVMIWPKVISKLPQMHVASDCVMAFQWAKALGWDAEITSGNSAVIAAGSIDYPMFSGDMVLPLVYATQEEAVSHLPANIQTIGHALSAPLNPALLQALAGRGVKRFVPLGQMHHFGHIWDGIPFWRELFEEIEVKL